MRRGHRVVQGAQRRSGHRLSVGAAGAQELDFCRLSHLSTAAALIAPTGLRLRTARRRPRIAWPRRGRRTSARTTACARRSPTTRRRRLWCWMRGRRWSSKQTSCECAHRHIPGHDGVGWFVCWHCCVFIALSRVGLSDVWWFRCLAHSWLAAVLPLLQHACLWLARQLS